MANFDVSAKWSSSQCRALMSKIPLNTFRIILFSFLKDCKWMHLNGYEKDFHLINLTRVMTYKCNNCIYQ